jgi:hypothetical protein
MTIPKTFHRTVVLPTAPSSIGLTRAFAIAAVIFAVSLMGYGTPLQAELASPDAKVPSSASSKGIIRRPLDAGSKDPARNPGGVVQGTQKKPLDSASPRFTLTPKQRYQN